MSYLGIDLGTSGLRALLMDEGGHPLRAVEVPLQVQTPHKGWAEQSPAAWVDALETAVLQLRQQEPAFASLRGIGVAGHMHGAVLLDSAGEVIRPCILWNDTRSHLEAARLDAQPKMHAISGNLVFPGFTAPKLVWVRTNEPENFARIHKVVLPAGYLNHYLTVGYVSDMSDSAGTSWLDMAGRAWSDDLLKLGHMTRAHMPDLVEGSQPAGELRAEIARRWGLKHPVTIAGGAGDNAAAACGIGALDQGQGFVSLGTSGVMLVANDGYQPAPETALHTFCHAIPNRWIQMGVMLSASASLSWLSGLVGQTPAALTAELGDDLKAPGDEIFLPYLSGERTPHNDASVRGAFFGLSGSTDRHAMTRAVLEGVAFGLRDTAEAMKATGTQPERLFAIGGGAASRYWVKVIATVLDTPLELPKQGEFGAASGAARLGRCAYTGEAPHQIMHAPEVKEVIPPSDMLKDQFDAAYQRFRQAYAPARHVARLQE